MSKAKEAADRLSKALDNDAWTPRRSHVEGARNDLLQAAELLAVTEYGFQAVSKANDDLQAVAKEMTFILDETMNAITSLWGEDGANKVRRHLMLAQKSRDTNAEIDELEKIFGGLDETRALTAPQDEGRK